MLTADEVRRLIEALEKLADSQARIATVMERAQGY